VKASSHCSPSVNLGFLLHAVVEGLGKASKRSNTSLTGAMASLGLEQQKASEPEAADAPAATPARRVQRFRKLSTLSAGQLRSMDQQQLHSLLAIRQQESQQRVGLKAAALAGADNGSCQRAAASLQVGQAARYEHIRRRRGLSSFSITEQLPDPLQQLASVYDLVRHEPEGAVHPTESATRGAQSAAWPQRNGGAAHLHEETGGGARQPGGAPPRRPSRAQRAAVQYDEGTLLCNYLPMVRQYLRSQGRDLPDPQPAAAEGGAAEQQRQGGESCMEGVEGEGGPSDSEYVYDLYAAVEDGGGEEAATGGTHEEGWWELHRGGRTPVVQVRRRPTAPFCGS
jgi:hypothetical protein